MNSINFGRDHSLKQPHLLRAGNAGRWLNPFNLFNSINSFNLPLFVALFALGLNASAAIPPAEKLLPDDTLILLTVPDFAKFRAIYKTSPQSQFWNDPAMKPFKDKFIGKWNEELVKPLERDLDVKLDQYLSLPQGQLTFAITQNGWQGKDEQPLGMLLLLDAKDKSSQLKTNLAELRKKWVDAGKPIRTEKIRNLEFSVLPISTNDIPKTLRGFLPKPAESQEQAPAEGEAKKSPPKSELIVGQADSLLIVGNSLKAVEKVVSRLSGGSAPTLSELAAYDANHQAMFREAPGYGWINIKAFVDLLMRKPAAKPDDDSSSPFPAIQPDKVVSALGLGGLKTIAFTFQSSADGWLLQFFLGAPEATRQGLFKILAGEPKESSPPAFVPATAVKFQRWRLDGQKAFATLQKMLGDINPQWLGFLNMILDNADTMAKEKDPAFDIRKNLIGNLGDDVISYEKAPRAGAPAGAAPSLVLLASPHADQLAASLKNLLAMFGGQASAPTDREFLGRKIFTVPLPSVPLPMAGAGQPGGPRTLSYAASGGYLALSTDSAMIEEYLRSSDSQAKSLREVPGLIEASQRVTGPGTGMFGYENTVETMRVAFETLKRDSASPTNASPLATLPGALGLPGQKNLKDWMDFSLLPAYDKVAKYFNFTVYAGTATVEGLTLKMFAPVPPALKGAK